MWWSNFLRLIPSTQPETAPDWRHSWQAEPLDAIELEGEVVETIARYKTGQVYWRATFWNAREIAEDTLHPGDIVQVLGYRHNLLWVKLIQRPFTLAPEPIPHSLAGQVEPTRSPDLSHPVPSRLLEDQPGSYASTQGNLLN